MRNLILFSVLILVVGIGTIIVISCGGGGGGADCTDADLDGYYLEADCDGLQDCDDTDPALNQDDADMDGYSTCDGDCVDDPAYGFSINPAAPELCDDLTDNDCDQLVDCYDQAACGADQWCADCIDADLDGYYAVTVLCSGSDDCADADSTVNPGVDQDLDGADICLDCDDTDPALNLDDLDEDGYTTCDGDCIDTDPLSGVYSSETCNGIDDDCDTLVDEDFGAGGTVTYTDLDGTTGLVLGDTCGAGECAGGTVVCSSDELSLTCTTESSASPETCDNLDNDCDGSVDDGNPGGGAVCSTGLLGECEWGTDTCLNGGFACVQTVFPAPEVCDGLDNDCDGAVDEGDPGGGVTCNTGLPGICSAGTTLCSSGSLVCQQNNASTAEVCNGLDDDCDGVIDNGNPGGGGQCPTGWPGVCYIGTWECLGGFLTCRPNTMPSEEVCDGADNDCDAYIDEGNPGGGGACDSGWPGVCEQGTYVCAGTSGVVCDPDTYPTAEVCNGLDDDCDGSVDEGDPGGGVSCDGTDTDLCEEGTTSCVGGDLSCSDNTPSTTDVCDGADNDCDPASADGSEDPQNGAPCDGGDSDLCLEGTYSCVAGALSCSDNTGNSVEVCDGLDNDCDGQVDEGNPGGGGSCTAPGTGVCADGTYQCSGGSLTCVGQQPRPEDCNGLDDDCNGQVDEGFPFSVPNGDVTCTSGIEDLVCDDGWEDCDGNRFTTGCEVQTHTNTPSNPQNLGSGRGDTECRNVICVAASETVFTGTSGVRGRYLRYTATEESNCTAAIQARVRLVVPTGWNYDLYVTGGENCANGCSSARAAGVDEMILVWTGDTVGNDDFTINIEVRYGDNICTAPSFNTPWQLTVEGTVCP